MDKKEITRIALAGLMSVGLIASAYFVVAYEPPVEMEKIENVDIYSDIASSDAKLTTANFITANGTMGNVEDDITQDKMKTNEAIYENSHRRLRALSRVQDAIIPGSPLIDGREENNIATHTKNMDSPYIYKVDQVEVSEPSKPETLTVFSENGPVDYDSVNVQANFASTRVHYTRANDTSYDGTHTQVSNKEEFDVKVTLVNVGDVWLIYDIENAEEVLNERFATWSGISNSSIDYSNNEETGTFVIEGIETYIEE